MGEMDLEAVAKAFQEAVSTAWSNVLIGNAPPVVKAAYQQMSNPSPGDWVAELTTMGMRGRSSLDAVGILEEIARERVEFSDPDFVWDETEDGPHPTETIYYIRTMDGRRFRWSNATIIAAPRRPTPEAG